MRLPRDVHMPDNGQFRFGYGTPAAAGTSQATGTQLTSQVNVVTAADGTKGVVLPSALKGMKVLVLNSVTNQVLKVYPFAGDSAVINSLSADASFSVGPGRWAEFVAASKTQWYVPDIAAATSTTTEQAFLTGITAGTAAASKALVLNSNGGISGHRFTSANLITQATPTAKTTSATLTAAEILVGIITGNQGGGAGAAYTLPTAADFETALIAAYPGLQNDDSFDFSVINISTNAAEIITMTTATGWTLVGDMTLAANATGDQSGGRFRARRVSSSAYVLYRMA